MPASSSCSTSPDGSSTPTSRTPSTSSDSSRESRRASQHADSSRGRGRGDRRRARAYRSLSPAGLDLEQRVGHEPMGFLVDPIRRFLVRGVHEAEDLAFLLVHPVLLVVDVVLVLDLEIRGVRARDGFGGDARDVVHVHVCRHSAVLLSIVQSSNRRHHFIGRSSSSTALSFASAATSASIVFWTIPPISRPWIPLTCASSENVSRVLPSAASNSYRPCGRTGPAVVWN